MVLLHYEFSLRNETVTLRDTRAGPAKLFMRKSDSGRGDDFT